MRLPNAGDQKWQDFSLQKATIHLSSDTINSVISLLSSYSIISLPKELCQPRGRERRKQTQYKVVDPISLADLENIHTRKGKYPTRPPPFGQLTWEEAKREKEEKLKKSRKERSPSTPMETTSTEAMDTEEAQEFGKEIVAKATERQLKRQEYARYQQRRQQTVEYDFPKPGTIPVPQLEKPREKREPRPYSVLSNL